MNADSSRRRFIERSVFGALLFAFPQLARTQISAAVAKTTTKRTTKKTTTTTATAKRPPTTVR